MTTAPEEPPRYIVQLPEGGCELDAKEICRRYRLRQINFSTPVRPVREMRFTRLDEDAAFAPALAGLYRWQKAQLGFWPMTICGIMIVAVILLIITTTPLDTINFMMIVLGFYLSGMLCQLVRFCGQTGPENDRFDLFGEILIPYYNSFAGYRLFCRFSRNLPEKPSQFWHIANTASWILLGLFYAGCVLLPHNREGAITLEVILLLMSAGLIVSVAPFWRQLCLLRRDWLDQNPKPAAVKIPLPAWAKTKIKFKEKIIILLCIFLFLVVYISSYYIAGQLRYHYELSKVPWPVAQTPAEFTEAWSVPAFPCKFSWSNGPTTQPMNLPSDISQQLAEALPQLMQIRDQLHRPLPAGDFLIAADIDPERRNIFAAIDYRYWRMLQCQTAETKERPELIQKLFDDLDQLSALAKLGLTIDYNALESCDWWRMQLLETTLPQLSPAQLQHQKEYWQKNLDTDLAVNTAKISYRADFILFNLLRKNRSWIYAWFDTGIVADSLEKTRQLLPLIYMDPYRGGRQFKKRNDANFFLMFFKWDDGTYLNQRFARLRTVSLLALSAIKLEEFRRANGKWPEHPELPPDPFDGQMLRYQDGKLLYSIGSDGIDNGGDDSCRKDKQRDIVFYLSKPGS